MFARPLFAASHGYGMGLAGVTEPEQADPLGCRGQARDMSSTYTCVNPIPLLHRMVI